jgi:IS5 family transposase
VVHGDAGYAGAQEHAPRAKVDWQIARRRGQVNKIANAKERAKAQRQERRKAQIRARVEHPFRVIKRQFGYLKVRFKGLMKNTAQIVTLFALANLYEVPLVFRLPSGSPQAACCAWSRVAIQSCMNCLGDFRPSVE